MTQWGPFLFVAVVVLVLVLVLARHSQEPLQNSGDRQASVEETPSPPESGETAPPSVEETAPKTKQRDTGASDGEVTEDTDVRGESPTDIDVSQESPADIEFTTGMLLANVTVTQGLTVVVLVAAAWYFAIPARAFGITENTTTLQAVALGAGFGLALWIANEGATRLADIVGAAYDEQVRELLAPDTVGGWAVLLFGVLPIIAIAEELLFRGALVGVPAAGFGISPWLLAVVSSMAFALGHGAQGRVGVVVTGALGFVLAAGYILTGSLLLVVVAHYVINAVEFLVHELVAVDSG